MGVSVFRRWLFVTVASGLTIAQSLRADWPFFRPEQRTIDVRDPAELQHAALPNTPPPQTISDPSSDLSPRFLSLDEAIRTALAEARVVRVLTGVAASASGRTIYDVAISNTTIDQQQARFDPTFTANNNWNRVENPQAAFTDATQTTSTITGSRSDNYNLNAGLAKTMTRGGTGSVNLNTAPTHLQPGVFPLNPSSRSSLDVRFTQPLLQGAGSRANLAPIVLTRIDTERSYFQFKDSVQELVRGVIDAYWSVVFARTDVWAREQQVKQAEFAELRATSQMRLGIVSISTVAQTRTALSSFRASLLSSRANQLQRAAALRNLLGFPAYDTEQLVPVTPPVDERLDVDWPQTLALAETLRPDLIELKLVLEADEQFLFQARNNALPRADAVALYRWNGLEGEMPIGTDLRSGRGQFTDWTLGVNFSVPLGLRQSRAALRQRELILARDRANLDQGLHNAAHQLALTLRNLAQYYEQYEAFTELRAASQQNLDLQLREFSVGRQNFLVVLQAITDWGNAVTSQAQSLLLYNTELANLERRTGSILETHGVMFFEERFAALSPLGRLHSAACYPQALPPTLNADRYESGTEPSESKFELSDPIKRLPKPEEIPPPAAP